MPRGLQRIQKLSEEAAARSAAYESGASDSGRALKLNKGETARGRFLEEGNGVWFLYMHELPTKPGQRYGDRVQCLDQDDQGVPCPGCEREGVRRTARMVINFVRYDEPKLRRGEDGKAVKENGQFVFDGVEPALLVWEAPQSAGGRLAYLEAQNNGGDSNHGITNHVVTIHRTHDDKNPWMIDVAEKDKAPEAFEKEFFSKKIEPPKAIQSVFPRFLSRPVMSYADMKRAYSGGEVPSGFSGGDAPAADNVYAQAAQNAAAGGMNLGAFQN